MIRPPDYVLALKPYIPGKPIEELEREIGIKDSVKLASNENPLGPSPKALRALIDCLGNTNTSNSINRYPDGSGYHLKKALAERLSIREDELILGNGSNELIDIAVRTFLQPGDEAVMAHPSFVVYPMAVQAIGGKSIQIPLKNCTHDLEAMADAITQRTKIIFVANPNNPTGTINNGEEFDRLMDRVPERVLVVIDEAYCEYVTDTGYADSIKHFRSGKDILILRTFSKIYGLAGLRIGYGMARDDILLEMNKLRPPFNTNSLAQKAAIYALQDDTHVKYSQEINEEGKKYLYEKLNSLKVRYIPTEANFIYILWGRDTYLLYNRMLRHGVIIRPIGSQEIRVTIGLPEENKRFIEVLTLVMRETL
jgi:histidinol-phosphate aminotransferase